MTHVPGITLNGAARPLRPGETVTDLVGEVTGRRIGSDGRAADGQRLGVAVARNAAVVPRSQWASVVLASGDDLEVLTAVQGG